MMTRKHSQILRTIPFLIGVALLCPLAYGKVIYVDDDAQGANNGTSWINAYIHLQDALADASTSEKPVEIRVAQGTYRPDKGRSQTLHGRFAAFDLINDVALKGGYAGSKELDPDARDVMLWRTMLSGDLKDNDVDLADANDPFEFLDEPTRAENSWTVVRSVNNAERALLDGFIVTGGNANDVADLWNPHHSGGGMYIDKGSPVVLHCIFTGNSANFGGALYNRGTPTITECAFSRNAAIEGGAMRNQNSNPVIANCLFSGNFGGEGGAVYNAGSSPILTNCTLSGNIAHVSGGAIFNRSSKPSLTNCILWADEVLGYERAEIYDAFSSRSSARYSNIQGGWAGAGNIQTDPLFAEAANGDYHLKSKGGRWDPNSASWVQDDVTSPCIDAGDPNSPMALEPAPNGGIINMGAYGGTKEASKSPPDNRSEHSGVVFMDIPGGTFQMGDHDGVGEDDERPVHTVTLDGFQMSKYETTNAQYAQYLNAAMADGSIQVVNGLVYASSDSNQSQPYCDTHGSNSYSQIEYGQGRFTVRSRDGKAMSDHPVVRVSWYGAKAFCDYYGYCLPTEAEWEYAARGGYHDPYYRYSWGSNAIDCSKANYYDYPRGYCNPLNLTSWPYTTPVGYCGPQGAYGLCDMGGNVWERCQDWYDSSYYSVSPLTNPGGPSGGMYRVLRGGSWNAIDYDARVAQRSWSTADDRFASCGFRACR